MTSERVPELNLFDLRAEHNGRQERNGYELSRFLLFSSDLIKSTSNPRHCAHIVMYYVGTKSLNYYLTTSIDADFFHLY